MGYTHYWTQHRNLKAEEWQKVRDDMQKLVGAIGIPLGNWEGSHGTRPTIDDEAVAFNGVGDNSHETFTITRDQPKMRKWETEAGFGFCKTANKPYDLAVVAALIYLATIAKSHKVSSDGERHDWEAGLAAARRVWPEHADKLENPIKA